MEMERGGELGKKGKEGPLTLLCVGKKKKKKEREKAQEGGEGPVIRIQYLPYSAGEERGTARVKCFYSPFLPFLSPEGERKKSWERESGIEVAQSFTGMDEKKGCGKKGKRGPRCFLSLRGLKEEKTEKKREFIQLSSSLPLRKRKRDGEKEGGGRFLLLFSGEHRGKKKRSLSQQTTSSSSPLYIFQVEGGG